MLGFWDQQYEVAPPTTSKPLLFGTGRGFRLLMAEILHHPGPLRYCIAKDFGYLTCSKLKDLKMPGRPPNTMRLGRCLCLGSGIKGFG